MNGEFRKDPCSGSTYISFVKRVLTCSNSGRREKKTADSTSVVDHQDWNRSRREQKVGWRDKDRDRGSREIVLYAGNDIGTKQTVFWKTSRISILHRNERSADLFLEQRDSLSTIRRQF